MKIKNIIGFIGLNMASILPPNDWILNFGQKYIRSLFAKMYLKKAGAKINIQKGSRFSHLSEIGNHSGIGGGCSSIWKSRYWR